MKTKIALLTILLFLSNCLTAALPAKAEASLAVNSPAAGQLWAAGSIQTITWSPANPQATEAGQTVPTVFINLNPASSCTAGNSSSCGSMVNAPYIIAQNAPDTGSYTWNIPSTMSLSYQGPMIVTVDLSDSSAMGTSSQFYLIAPNSYISSVGLDSPNGGQQWTIGSNETIQWSNASSTVTEVNISLVPVNVSACSVACAAASSSIYSLASNVANNGSYFWNINNTTAGQAIPPGQYIISIADANTGNIIGSSAGPFTLVAQTPQTLSPSSAPPQISGINPASGNIGQIVNIIGSGFTPSGNSVQFGQGTYINNLASSNGLSVQFVVPGYTQPCPPNSSGACSLAVALISSGAYGISVSNASGISNTMPFEVTGNNPNSTVPLGVSTTGTTTAIGFPDGDLLMASGNPTVYLVSNGQFVPFTSSAIFLGRGYQWPQVETISQSQLNPAFISATPVLAQNGSIIKAASNPTVYLIVNGQKSAIPSLAVFNALGLSFDNLIILSSQELQNYPTAPQQQ